MAANARDIETLFQKISKNNAEMKNYAELSDYLSQMVRPYDKFKIHPKFDGCMSRLTLTINNPKKLEYGFEMLFLLFEYLQMEEKNPKFNTIELEHRDYQRLFDQNPDSVMFFTQFLEKCKIKTVRLRNIDIDLLSKTKLAPFVNGIECFLVDNILMPTLKSDKNWATKALELKQLLQKVLKDNSQLSEFNFGIIGRCNNSGARIRLQAWNNTYYWEDQLLIILKESSIKTLKVTVDEVNSIIWKPIQFMKSLTEIGVLDFFYRAEKTDCPGCPYFAALGRLLPSQRKEYELGNNSNPIKNLFSYFNGPFPPKHLESLAHYKEYLTKDFCDTATGAFRAPKWIPPLKYLRHAKASVRQEFIKKDAEFLKDLALEIKNFRKIDLSSQLLFPMMARLSLKHEVDLSPLSDNLKGIQLVSLNLLQTGLEFSERKSLLEFLRVILENENMRELDLSFNFILQRLSVDESKMLGKWVRDSKLISLDLSDYHTPERIHNKFDCKALLANFQAFVKGLSEGFNEKNFTLKSLKGINFYRDKYDHIHYEFEKVKKICNDLLIINQIPLEKNKRLQERYRAQNYSQRLTFVSGIYDKKQSKETTLVKFNKNCLYSKNPLSIILDFSDYTVDPNNVIENKNKHEKESQFLFQNNANDQNVSNKEEKNKSEQENISLDERLNKSLINIDKFSRELEDAERELDELLKEDKKSKEDKDKKIQAEEALANEVESNQSDGITRAKK